MSQPARPSRQPLAPAVRKLGVISFLMDLSSEIYHALLPAFLTVTLGLPAAALGALDGVSEATANLAKVISGRWSDRMARRKPWIVWGYGLAALSKPLFPLAQGLGPLVGARFIDRVGKGVRGSARDAMIADVTPPDQRGRAFGLRQAMDSAGAFVAPLLAVALAAWWLLDLRTIFWIAVIPALLSFALTLTLAEDSSGGALSPKAALGGWRSLDPGVVRLVKMGFLFGLARFSESFLILKAMDVGLAPALSPLALTLFNLSYLTLAYPAGAWSDRLAPRSILLAGIALLVIADLWLASATTLAAVAVGILLWGAHMALSQGVLSRMVADAAPADQRATAFGLFFFAQGVAALLASLGAGLLWDRVGAAATFSAAAGVAALAGAMLWLMPAGAPKPPAAA